MSAENSDSAVEQVATIGWADFDRVDLRIGTIVHAEPFPEARRPAIRMQIDFGPELGILKSSAQIPERYTPDSLIDRQVVAVVNLPPKQIGPMRSECLVTGFHDENGAVVLCVPDAEVPPGTRLR
jgi:tRNA-binding protein